MGDIFPWDEGYEYNDFIRTTLTEGAWGDGRHLAVASMVYEARIQDVGDHPYIFGHSGPLWTIRFGARLEHYDVVRPDAPTGAEPVDPASEDKDRDQEQGTGSTQARKKKHETESLEHTRHKKAAHLGIQGIAKGKGWYGVWDAAKANDNGRNGGTAVLARRSVQTMRNGRMERMKETPSTKRPLG